MLCMVPKRCSELKGIKKNQELQVMTDYLYNQPIRIHSAMKRGPQENKHHFIKRI